MSREKDWAKFVQLSSSQVLWPFSHIIFIDFKISLGLFFLMNDLGENSLEEW